MPWVWEWEFDSHLGVSVSSSPRSPTPDMSEINMRIQSATARGSQADRSKGEISSPQMKKGLLSVGVTDLHYGGSLQHTSFGLWKCSWMIAKSALFGI